MVQSWLARIALGLLPIVLAACGLSVSSFCQPSPGEIVFGLELANNTSVTSCSRSFKQDGDFAFVGIFPRHVTGFVAMEVVKDTDPSRRAGGYEFTAPGNYFSGKWHLSDLPGPGHYVFRMTLDSEVLATGEFDLTD